MHSFGIFVRSEKLQNESSPNFSNFRPEFCPEFCSEFSPNFSGSFRASFRGKRRPEKIHQKSPPFFNTKFPGKHEKNIHKMFLESRQSKFLGSSPEVLFPDPFWTLPGFRALRAWETLCGAGPILNVYINMNCNYMFVKRLLRNLPETFQEPISFLRTFRNSLPFYAHPPLHVFNQIRLTAQSCSLIFLSLIKFERAKESDQKKARSLRELKKSKGTILFRNPLVHNSVCSQFLEVFFFFWAGCS